MFIDQSEFDDELHEENFDEPDELYARDIENIHDPDLRARKIEATEKIGEQEQELDRKLKVGEISDLYWSEYELGIRPKKIRLSTSIAL